MRFTVGPGETDEDLVWELFYATIDRWLDSRVSLVVDVTTYLGVTERDISERLLPRSQLVNFHCTADEALARFARRVATHPHFAGAAMELASLVERAQRAYEMTTSPLPLDQPLLHVDTAAAYSPDLSAIVEWVLKVTGRSLPLRRHSPG